MGKNIPIKERLERNITNVNRFLNLKKCFIAQVKYMEAEQPLN